MPWALLTAAACGSGKPHPGDLGSDGQLDRHTSRLDAGEQQGSPDDLADAGVPGQNGDGSDAGHDLQPDSGSGLGPSSCGNGTIDPGEECDPALPASESCEARGFDSGLLGCSAQCTFSVAGCSGVENCFDGRDNDGDGFADCADSDCSALCGDACAAPVVIAENASVSGTTVGHPAASASSCSPAAPSGPEVTYQVTVSEDSKLDVALFSDQDLTLSLRSSCADLGSELACGGRTRVTVDASAGQTYFILVDGASAGGAGHYQLQVQARQGACGDGVRDSDEECDDGNTRSTDGCSSGCLLERSESEDNGRRSRADTFNFTPWFAQIRPAGDVDYFRVSLTATSSTLVAETLDLGDGACALGTMDPLIDIVDSSSGGGNVLASDDDGGQGTCARAVATGLAAGTYYVRVQAAAGASPATFPYRLELSVGVCGDGDPTLGEGCDDGNLTAGDGCDSRCQVESGP
ncbi:MAG TPA: DVUA0089 family protein [Polyangiaceae bacterium]|nr:DVUA0089 family protein [Polyangiaceae bacterium]